MSYRKDTLYLDLEFYLAKYHCATAPATTRSWQATIKAETHSIPNKLYQRKYCKINYENKTPCPHKRTIYGEF